MSLLTSTWSASPLSVTLLPELDDHEGVRLAVSWQGAAGAMLHADQQHPDGSENALISGHPLKAGIDLLELPAAAVSLNSLRLQVRDASDNLLETRIYDWSKNTADDDGFAWEGPRFFGPGIEPMPNRNRRVRVAVIWDDGHGPALYVGGEFHTVAGQVVNSIARWDGKDWSPVGGGVSCHPACFGGWGVHALLVYEGALIVGGNFTRAGNVEANHVARWDGHQWSSLGTGMSGLVTSSYAPKVQALTAFDGALIAGGSFTEADGVTVNGIARWNGKQWLPVSDTGFNRPVRALAEFQGDLVVGGEFFSSGGYVGVDYLARWNGEQWGPLGEGITGCGFFGCWITALAVFDDALMVGGTFTGAGGDPAASIARWDGLAWSALKEGVGGGLDVTVWTLMATEDALLVGGNFSTAGGMGINDIARWDGHAWSAVGSGQGVVAAGLFAFVSALAMFQDRLIVGGQFHTIDGITGNNIANWDGQAWSALGEPSDLWLEHGVVRALTLYDGALVVAGTFPRAGDAEVNSIARWDGYQWSPLGSGIAGSDVFALEVYEGDLIAGGLFTEIDGQVVNRVARWDGSQWSPLGDGVQGNIVRALKVYDGELIAGGNFTEADGVTVNHVARWNGNEWLPLGSGVTIGSGTGDPVHALAVYEDELIAAGRISAVGGVPVNHIARWNGSEWSALGDGRSSELRALTVHERELIAAGRGTAVAASWDGSEWTQLGVTLTGTVSSLAVFEGNLIAAGDIRSVGGAAANNIVRWNGSEWLPLSGPAGMGVDTGGDASVHVLAAVGIDGPQPLKKRLFAGGNFAMTGGAANWALGIYGPRPGLLQVEPPELDFGEVMIGTTQTLEVIVVHAAEPDAGNLVLLNTGLAGDRVFGLQEDTGGCRRGTALAPTEVCVAAIHFTAGEAGIFSGTYEIEIADGQVATVTIEGIAVPPPDAVFSDRFEAR